MIENNFLRLIIESTRDLAPIILVIFLFQVFVIRQPIPNLLDLVTGTLLVVFGLTFFIQGLEQSLFPVGEQMAFDFAAKGSVMWLVLFAFCLGFGATIAEPALIAVADEAARVAASGGVIESTEEGLSQYAWGLRLTVAVSVGLAIVLGVLRILLGWPLHYLIVVGYMLIVIMTTFAPDEIIGIAYDSGGVATSTINVPLVTALGVGLASAVAERNPLTDGFGLIALASLTPIIFVLAYGMLF